MYYLNLLAFNCFVLFSWWQSLYFVFCCCWEWLPPPVITSFPRCATFTTPYPRAFSFPLFLVNYYLWAFFLFSSFFSPFLLSSFYLSSSSSSLFAFPHVGVLMDYILRNKKGEGKHEPRGITQLHSRQNHSKFFPSPLCTSWKCNGIGGIFIPSELALYNNISASLAER